MQLPPPRVRLPLALGAVVALTACAHRAPLRVVTPSGLEYTVVAPGAGPSARAGAYVTIHETTSFMDGRVHFSTAGRPPIRFLLGGGQVIDGLDEGVTCMKAGERRRLVVPPSLSRRSTYPEGLSPDDVLVYDVTLVTIEDGPGGAVRRR
jgi:FKBP-type peptidyl-prolyl cis-trans isomerase